jgi:hypothetical protein
LKLLMFLPQPPKYLNYRCAPPCLAKKKKTCLIGILGNPTVSENCLFLSVFWYGRHLRFSEPPGPWKTLFECQLTLLCYSWWGELKFWWGLRRSCLWEAVAWKKTIQCSKLQFTVGLKWDARTGHSNSHPGTLKRSVMRWDITLRKCSRNWDPSIQSMIIFVLNSASCLALGWGGTVVSVQMAPPGNELRLAYL